MDCISALPVVEVLLWDFCFLQANPLYCGFMVCRCLWWTMAAGFTIQSMLNPHLGVEGSS